MPSPQTITAFPINAKPCKSHLWLNNGAVCPRCGHVVSIVYDGQKAIDQTAQTAMLADVLPRTNGAPINVLYLGGTASVRTNVTNYDEMLEIKTTPRFIRFAEGLKNEMLPAAYLLATLHDVDVALLDSCIQATIDRAVNDTLGAIRTKEREAKRAEVAQSSGRSL